MKKRMKEECSKMTFIHPSWFDGLLIWGMYFIPVFIFAILVIVCGIKVFTSDYEKSNKYSVLFVVFLILTVISVPVCEFGGGYLWHESYEIPSIQEKNITVDSWQVKPGAVHSEGGMMVIDNADQLMLITTDGEGFLNDENFLFQKFETRDILNTLKPGATYTVKYYGWREGFNSGFPNILSVEKVIDESNATNVSLSDYFGTKLTVE